MAETTPVHSPEMNERFYERAFLAKDEGTLPIAFRLEALERYREAGYTMYRTRSAGRVQSPDGWRLDFGIVDDAGVFHMAVRDVYKLPRAERQHLARYVAAPPLNGRYLKMHMGQGACVDEGDIESWDGRPRA